MDKSAISSQMFVKSTMILRSCLILISCAIFVTAITNKYCDLSCDFVVQKFQHTVCQRGNEQCGPSPQCGKDFKVVELNDFDRQYIVDIHNYLRNKVALGYENRGGKQSKAANMQVMNYNRELELIAQCWANMCNGNPLIHDSCRRTTEYEHIGQNLGVINSSSPEIDLVSTIKQLTLLWYNEVAFFKSEWVNETQNRGPEVKVGHYTQMIWSDTNEIGCALVYYTTPAYSGQKWHHMLYVCNYGPGGNYLGYPVYEIGKPASRCPYGQKKHYKYLGLCGKTRTVRETSYPEDGSINIFDFWAQNKQQSGNFNSVAQI